MIFDCPRCEAENAVPVTAIPPEGSVVMCRGCQLPFRVMLSDSDAAGGESDERTNVAEPKTTAATRIDAITTAEMSDGAEDSHGATSRLEPGITGPILGSGPEPARESPDLEALRALTAASQSDEQAVSYDPAQGATVALPVYSNASLRAWWNRNPLVFAIAAFVAIAVLAVLVFVATRNKPTTLGRDDNEPLAARIGANDATELLRAKSGSAAADVAASGSPVAPAPFDRGRARNEPVFDVSECGAAGECRVATEHAPVFAYARAKSQVVSRLGLGQRVRALGRVDAFALVLADDAGPAGFMRTGDLAEGSAVERYLKKTQFAGCEERGRCKEVATTETRACKNACDQDEARPSGATNRACKLACVMAQRACTAACSRVHEIQPSKSEPRDVGAESQRKGRSDGSGIRRRQRPGSSR